MPSPNLIASQCVSIVVSPTKRQSNDVSLAATVLEEDGRGSRPCQCQSSPSWRGGGKETAPCFECGILPSYAENTPPQQVQVDHHQDVFEQWDALFGREGCEAYTIQECFPADDDQGGREKFCSWCYEIVDHFDIVRSTASIALSYFDRLVSNGLVEKGEGKLELVGMTCLYLAVKINSSGGSIFDAKHIASFSHGFFTENHIFDMENHICQVFDWYMNPPVPDMYIDIITPLLANEYDINSQMGGIGIDGRVRHELVQQSKYLCELSVMDAYFSNKKPSAVAHAAVLVAMDHLRFPIAASKWFRSLALDHDPKETNLCAQRFHQYSSEEEHDCTDETSEEENEGGRVRTVTPTKADIPSGLKRMRHEALGEPSYESEEGEEASTMSHKKRRMR